MGARKRRKKASVKKVPAKKSKVKAKKKIEVGVDKNDPVYKLKPNDIIRYTYLSQDGEKTTPELHLVLAHPYEMDPERIQSRPTLRLHENGALTADTLFCWGPKAAIVEVLTDSYKLSSEVAKGKIKWKLSKLRKGKAK